ncbi:Uu.00g062880.m01.CDS01 [Anthostomella pinea]|uniref:Uu.00g062880.m01.CDS01 n=1 Tax=Anthostomella pinea TaxID=933095 RepID=A0AAI8VUH7_9PEZI|nr:Uu.00g062880.m01.CDS01 [Anthostomella pinea]
MQQPRPQQRAPGSFSPLTNTGNGSSNAHPNQPHQAHGYPHGHGHGHGHGHSQPPAPGPAPSRPQIRRIESSSSDDTISISRSRGGCPPHTPVGVTSPSFPNFAAHPNSSTNSLQNFSRPSRPSNDPPAGRTSSPLTLPPTRVGHVRKHSQTQTQGHFEPTLPSTSSSNLSHIAMAQPSPVLSASHIAAQAAMQHQQHSRHRSQTVPAPGSESYEPVKRPGPKPVMGPRSPPVLSLTEASAPRDHGFGNQSYHNGLLGNHAAAAAANVVFPRTSPQSSPSLPTQEPPMPPMPPPLTIPEKPTKSEKSKVKLFSRPKKIDTKGETNQRPLPSPGKIGSALASLQRGNFSTTSLADSQSFYSIANSSTATIRPIDTQLEREGKEKEKERRHHFLSRQKHKLSSKDDYHLPLSSAASNSRPVDPNAPTSLYNFNIPPSPGPTNNLGKSVSGLDLRHGGRALREKRKEEKLGDVMRHDNDSSFALGSEWAGPGSLGSTANNNTATSYQFEPVDSGKYGLNSMSFDDAWPYLKAKLLVIFEGGDLRLPVEDFNRVVTMHIQYCIQRRAGHIIVDDLRDLLATGFSSLDHTLRMTPEDRLIPALVELWLFTFTNILPYMQAVFLPLDLEFSGSGALLSPEQARDFWGGAVAHSPGPNAHFNGSGLEPHPSPASKVLEVRRLVLLAYRDAMVLPRYEKLKAIFSRLSLEHLPSSLGSLALASPPVLNDSATSLSTSPSDGYSARPGTAMSLDPSVGSYNSNSTTVFGNDSNPSRSRAISNVSYGSGASEPASAGAGSLLRPFTPQTRESDRGREILGSVREQNVEDSKQVTEMVGRMLQCMSVLASVGTGADGPSSTATGPAGADEPSRMVLELGRLLKLNWLGRGRTGRNRRGMVGGRVKRPDISNNSSHSVLREGVREGVSVAG